MSKSDSPYPPGICWLASDLDLNPKNGPPLRFCESIFFYASYDSNFFFEGLHADISNNFSFYFGVIRYLEKFLEQFEMKSFAWNCQNRTLHIPQESNGWLPICIGTKKATAPYVFVNIFFSMHSMTLIFFESSYGCK